MKYMLNNDAVYQTNHINDSVDALFSIKHWVLVVTAHSFYDAISLIYMMIILFFFGILISFIIHRTKFKKNIDEVNSLPWVSFIVYRLVSLTVRTIALKIQNKLTSISDNNSESFLKLKLIIERVEISYLDKLICWFNDPTRTMLKDSKNYFRFKKVELL